VPDFWPKFEDDSSDVPIAAKSAKECCRRSKSPPAARTFLSIPLQNLQTQNGSSSASPFSASEPEQKPQPERQSTPSNPDRSSLLYRLVFTKQAQLDPHALGQPVEDEEVILSLHQRQRIFVFLQVFGTIALTVVFVAIPPAVVL